MAAAAGGAHVRIGQVEGDVRARSTQPQRRAQTGQVRAELRHRGPPGVTVIQGAGRIEGPAEPLRVGGRVGPAVAHEVRDPQQQVLMRLGQQIQRRGAEGRGVHPGPHLARDHLAAVQMRGRRRPAGLGQGRPARALALDQVRAALGAERDRGLPVALQAEAHPVLLGPGAAGGHEALLDQLGQGTAVVLAHLRALRPVDLEQVQHVEQLVTPAGAEVLEQARRPARVVHLEAVAEHGAEQLCGDRLEDRTAHGVQVVAHRGGAEMVHDRALRAGGGPLDLLSGHLGPGQQHGAGPAADGDLQARPLDGQALPARRRQALAQVHRDQLVPRPGGVQLPLERRGAQVPPLPAQAPRGMLGADVGAAVGPSAAEGHVQPEPQLARALGGMAEVREHLGREVVRGAGTQRVHQRHLGAPEPRLGHGAQLAVDLGPVHVGAEPPPAHHRPGSRIRVGQGVTDLVSGVHGHGAPPVRRRRVSERESEGGSQAVGGAQVATASSRAQGTPSSLKGLPVASARVIASSSPSIVG